MIGPENCCFCLIVFPTLLRSHNRISKHQPVAWFTYRGERSEVGIEVFVHAESETFGVQRRRQNRHLRTQSTKAWQTWAIFQSQRKLDWSMNSYVDTQTQWVSTIITQASRYTSEIHLNLAIFWCYCLSKSSLYPKQSETVCFIIYCCRKLF